MSSNKLNWIAFCDGSTNPNPGPSGFGCYMKDDKDNEYVLYGPISRNGTNNIAELTAVIKILTLLKDQQDHIGKLDLYLDSRYVLDGMKYIKGWVKNNWITSKGTPVANKELFIELDSLVKLFTKTKIDFLWCKGHSGIHGNEQADRYANAGRILSLKGETSDVLKVNGDTVDISSFTLAEDIIIAAKEKKAKKVAVPPLSQLLSGKRWFFNTNTNYTLVDGRCYYTSSTYSEPPLHEKDKDLPDYEKFLKRSRNSGKRAPDSHYAIVITKEPIRELESLRELFNNTFEDKYLPAELELNKLTKSTVWAEVVENNNKFTTIQGSACITMDGSFIGGIINPPKLIFRLQDIYTYGFKLLEQFSQQVDDMRCFDITESILVPVKNKQQIIGTFTNQETFIDISINLDDSTMLTPRLTIGLDIPNRNNFSSLLKQSNDIIKITLLVTDITDHSYRIATIIERAFDIGLYYSSEANLRLR